jgi:hypothetical protein
VDTAGYGGRSLSKSAEVISNDPKEPVVQLTVTGVVDKFASITPSPVILRGVAGENLSQTVRIIPEAKYPFKLVEARPRDGRNLTVTLSPAAEGGAGGYALLVQNTKGEAGSYTDSVVLKTDSPLKPEIDIRVVAYLKPPSPEKKTN